MRQPISTRPATELLQIAVSMKCPICKKEVKLDDPDMPFCSDRCRLIDLGNWASEKYVISTPAEPSHRSRTRKIEDCSRACSPPGSAAATRPRHPAPPDRSRPSLIAWPLHAYAGYRRSPSRCSRCPAAIPAIWAAGVTALQVGLKDPQIVVVDEVVGQWIALAGATATQLEELARGASCCSGSSISGSPRRCASSNDCPAEPASCWTT